MSTSSTSRVGRSVVRGWRVCRSKRLKPTTPLSSCKGASSSSEPTVRTNSTGTWRSTMAIASATTTSSTGSTFYGNGGGTSCYSHPTTATLTSKRFLSSSSHGLSTTSTREDDEPSSPSSTAIPSRIIDVTPLAEQMRQEVRNYTQRLLRNNTSTTSTTAWQDSPTTRLSDSRRRPLKLVGILAHAGPLQQDTEFYSQRIAAACHDDGIHYELIRCKGTHPKDILQAIHHANQDDTVNGILVFYPIFKEEQSFHPPNDYFSKTTAKFKAGTSRSTPEAAAPAAQSSTKLHGPYKDRVTGVYYKTYDEVLRDAVDPFKDVEGLSLDYNVRRNNNNDNKNSDQRPQDIFPCTAMSVKHILDHFHFESSSLSSSLSNPKNGVEDTTKSDTTSPSWQGQTVSIINRSEILGRPLATMLASSGANVYSIDVDSILQFRPGGRVRRCNTTSSSSSERMTLEWCLAQSSVVVTAVPHIDFQLPSHAIAPGTTVVNVSAFSNVREETLLNCPGIKYIPQVRLQKHEGTAHPSNGERPQLTMFFVLFLGGGKSDSCRIGAEFNTAARSQG
jgi:5,10-methylene-tetrahydrofolate dehydrogenase/methenyl tetrahydrofolate cyclohydrolase